MASDGVLSSSSLEMINRAPLSEEKHEQPPKIKICLDISKRSLSDIPLYDVANLNHLQFLYLQGNTIEKLPKDFFYRFPSLRHLDLRQNCLIELPVSIAGHNSLEVLLLQDNRLKSLPCELGQVPRLRKLQFSGNPLEWPPQKILSSGLVSILSYLRKAFMEQLSTGDTDPIPKANDYECTKDEETRMQLVQRPFLEKLSTKAVAKDGNSQSYSSLHSHCEDSSTVKTLEQTDKKDSTALVYLKGGSKQLKTRASSNVNHTQNRSNTKSTSLRAFVSRGHAQAIIKGQTYPLGYRKRTGLSTTKIYKTLLQQLWLNQLKYTLQSQDAALQKQKTSEALKQWRQDARELQKNKFEHNWSGLTFPYDLDANSLKMVSRMDWQTFQNKSLEKRGHSKPSGISCTRAMGLQEKINQILRSFEEMKSSDAGSSQNSFFDTDPSSRCKMLAEEMKKISNLQKAVRALRLSTE
ncbi:leucine-rich repeat-containing protein 27-like isoform X3 [Thrips palmi]|uniref:Leucine-rich repeat-containing protein 27-like isoform X3 n=1 Tax=Thrips palmi TaxID=161013 RepID=A0A6P9A9A9_THRPL|nr:leucine-rich repeat-containing protein 27-like isoform X3 [Thrips palmi]